MRVVIIDDDSIVLMSLKAIVEASGIEVLATGKDGEDAVRLYEEYSPDVLLSDIRMEVLDGIEAAKQILGKQEEAKILFLTTFSDDEYVINALRYGVKGYILKQDFEGIVPALQAVHMGQTVFGGEIVTKIPTMQVTDKSWDKFEEKGITAKELEVVKLVAEGMSNKEIAEALFLSEGTVRNYLSSILDKLELRDRTQLVVYYYK